VQYGELAFIYANLDDLQKAEEMYLKSLETFQLLGDEKGIATQYDNLGSLYAIRGDNEKAEKMFHDSLAIFQELEEDDGVTKQYFNLANVYSLRDDLQKVEEMYLKSLEVEESSSQRNPKRIESKLDKLIALYVKIGNWQRAEETYLKKEGSHLKQHDK